MKNFKTIEDAAELYIANHYYLEWPAHDYELAKESFIDGAKWMATRDRWNKYPEDKPKKVDWYIVACSDSEKSKVEYWDGNGWWNVYYSQYMDDITHFQELPSPPQSKNTK